MGHQNRGYTSEKEMTKPGKKRERSSSGEKEHKKKLKRPPINCAICESKGEVENPAFNSNRDLFFPCGKDSLGGEVQMWPM